MYPQSLQQNAAPSIGEQAQGEIAAGISAVFASIDSLGGLAEALSQSLAPASRPRAELAGGSSSPGAPRPCPHSPIGQELERMQYQLRGIQDVLIDARSRLELL